MRSMGRIDMMNSPPLWSLDYLMGRWRPEIGDPTCMGWLTVASYFLCALVVWYLAALYKEKDPRAFTFWFLIGVAMVLLGINKQLDLQTLLTEIGRQIARAQGWMDQRRTIQFWFIVMFALASGTVFLWLTLKFRDLFKRFPLAFSGLFFLLGFVVIRAISFHHIEEMLEIRLVGMRMNWIIELAGIYMILAAGFQEIIRATIREN